MLGLKSHSLAIAKTLWRRRERGCGRERGCAQGCAEGSGISFASVVGHCNRLHLQKSRMVWQEDHLCSLSLVQVHSRTF